jgi:transposase InsO family protein
MTHANARTNTFARELIVSRVASGHLPGEVAKQLGVSRATVYKWIRRHRAEGRAGLADRSSRPHVSPTATPGETVERIRVARTTKHAGPVALAAELGVPASTIGAVIRRLGLPLLSEVDRVTGELVRGTSRKENRYEHSRPGDLLHIDVKKLGRVPPGGGWRAHGRTTAVLGHKAGWDYVHVAIDDHSRVVYAEVHPDEKAVTCAGFLHRAVAWFRTRGVMVRRLLTDNAKSYRVSHVWAAVCTALQLKRRFTKPRHPWTNGKAERMNRTLLTEWAYSKAWTNNDLRTAELDIYLEHYNTRRGHSALGGKPPITRLAA